ncbi:MAG TPA: UbiA family prenyltransferase [Rectinemataceae bacterium]|nr:UbiA family prenyltransferase [Rectinemataceae bacterium]
MRLLPSPALRDLLVLLRIPFSLFLLPIYLAALAAAENPRLGPALASFLIIHFLLYPASQAFNSHYDRDEGPIGSVEHPPKPGPGLLGTALALDAVALVAGLLFVGPIFAAGLFLYGGASKLYSWDKTRLKARPFGGWLMTGLGQGGLTYVLVLVSVDPRGLGALGPVELGQAAAVSALLLGVFPLTQIYQHGEDARRGDLTISRLLGIRGTFVLSATFLALGTLGLGLLLLPDGPIGWLFVFFGLMSPVVVLFLAWATRCWRNPADADWRSAMRINMSASVLLSLFYLTRLVLPYFRFLGAS